MRLGFAVTIATAITAGSVVAQECRGVDPASGYPISVTLLSPTEEGSQLATSLARTVAFRWRVPSRRRNAYRGWERVRDRTLPPEPRWADDWDPEEKHQATMRFVLFEGEASLLELSPLSGDDRFDESLETIIDEPMPGGPEWPGIASGDSLLVEVRFGGNGEGDSVVRFAAEQTPVRLNRNSMRVEPRRPVPRSAAATVKYDVLPSGLVEPRSIEVLRSNNNDLTDAILEALRMAQFDPATSNCRPIAQSVVQTFGN